MENNKTKNEASTRPQLKGRRQMKQRNTNLRAAIRSRALTTAASLTCATALMLPCSALAGDGNQDNPSVMPPQAIVGGLSNGEWAAKWWQWVLSIPADRNPLLDTTGGFAGEAQYGHVWFLAGTFGNSVQRSFNVPSGKHLFLPVYNWIFGAGVFDCEPSIPGVPCDVPALQLMAATNTAAAEVLEVSIDGVPVQNVKAYQAASPAPFSLDLPEGNVFGLEPGGYYPNVTDGVWLMIKPLPVGEHVIRQYVWVPDTLYGPIEFEVVHHITITPKS